jgi:hypothetical protein
MWHRPIVPTGVTEDRCIRAIQVKPQGNAKGVVHHANSTFQRADDEGGFESTGDRASEYAMGKLGELIPDGVCRIIPANSFVAWDIHLFPGGLGSAAANAVIEDNVVEMGLWLWPADYQYEYKQDLALYGIREGELIMKPNGTARRRWRSCIRRRVGSRSSAWSRTGARSGTRATSMQLTWPRWYLPVRFSS